METVDVLLSGNILPGTDLATAVEELSGLTGFGREQVQTLISSGKERVVKRGISMAIGQSYLNKLTAIGVEARLRSSAQSAASTPTATSQAARQSIAHPPATSSNAKPTHTSSASLAMQVSQTTAAQDVINPYSAPRAEMDVRRSGTALQGGWRDTAAKVPASHGYHWFKDAWSLFTSRKGTWIGAMLLVFITYAIVGTVSSLLSPLLSNLANTLLSCLFAGGIAIMAHRQSEDEAVGALSVFVGFGQKPVQLLLLALILIAYTALIFGVALITVDYEALMALASGKVTPALAQQGTGVMLTFLGVMILMILLGLAGIFAPALVSLADESALSGLYKGLRAGLKNWSAFLVNVLVLILVSSSFGLVIGFVFGLIEGFSSSPTSALVLAALLTLLFAIPFLGTVWLMPYTATRDVFYDEP